MAAGSAMGLTRGAGLAAIQAAQWGTATSHLPELTPGSLPRVIVAVLDTGVAYEDFVDDDGTTYVAAPSLASSRIVAPWDFVSDDGHANDDHQHGTHLAGIIASHGDIDGIAPGVSLMPLKVLDADNAGSEFDLIEALYYAADEGAHVVNLSLTFGQGYTPSQGLLDAIDYVADAGVVMVGASGNDGASEASWPAASPRVVAVGGHCPSARSGYDATPYSNLGPSVDLLAPGGCMDRDVWGHDGIPDGIVGETIALNQPASPGYWVMGGTSQAAAFVSGAVALFIASGGDGKAAALSLHHSSFRASGKPGFGGGQGAGILQVGSLLRAAQTPVGSGERALPRFDISLTPFLIDNGDGTVTPKARVVVVDAAGHPATGGEVIAQLQGSTEGTVSCSVSARSRSACVLVGPPAPRLDASGAPAPLAWKFAVTAVVQGGRFAYRPSGVVYASDTLESVVAQLRDRPDLADAALAFHWPRQERDGHTALDESYVVVDHGTGISTSPFGLVLSPEALQSVASMVPAELDGVGISTSPFGIRVIDVSRGLSASGISISPFRMVAFEADDILNGKGISTSPFGMRAITSPNPEVCLDACETFWNDPIQLATGEILAPRSVEVTGTALHAQLLEGGWTTPDGNAAASSLATQEALELHADAEGTSVVEPPIEFRVTERR